MSSVQDHPDIEKLPLEIDGIRVRETIREIFRNPDNGTPDHISKAGCLALALRSNVVGGRDRGCVVWNAWRKEFPGYIDDSSRKNCANFEGVNFSNVSCGEISFKRFDFGSRASFKRATFQEKISFNDAIFGEFSSFHQAEFFKRSSFQSSAKNDDGSFLTIRFSGCRFVEKVDFSNRSFLGSSSFKAASFCVPPSFHGCELHQDTSFEGAKFPAPTGREEAARAYRTLKLAFSKQQAVREEQRFFRLEMAEETMGYRNKAKQALQEFKLLTGLREGFTWILCKAYAVLREGFTWILYKAYSVLSDYGFSVARPLVLMVAAWLVFATIYGHSSGQEVCWVWYAGCELRGDWLGYSLRQALPIFGFDKPDHPTSLAMKDVAVGWLFLHKTISLAALFLIGLALRNLFKLK